MFFDHFGHIIMFPLIYFLCALSAPVGAVEIWVDAVHGNDAADGTENTPLRTLQKATTLATAGSTVHILPGIYRETLQPIHSGTATQPIIYQAEIPNTVTLSGAEIVTAWQPLAENTLGFPETKRAQIFWTDLTDWNEKPRFVAKINALTSQPQRFITAREPDWQVATQWKQHEFWWTADGGKTVVTCTPAIECEATARSRTQLIDIHDDETPENISRGNLTSLGDLTGATLVATDNSQGYFVYRRTLTAHDVAAGHITVTPEADYKTLTAPGLGWGSKYYVENHPRLLDSEGEYWFDVTTKRLYILAYDLTSLEISKRATCVDLSNLSFITLDSLNIEFCQETAIQLHNASNQGSQHIYLKNLKISHANYGVRLEQNISINSISSNSISQFRLENSEISEIDTNGIFSYPKWEPQVSFSYAPISHIFIKNNQFHHLSYQAQQDRTAGLEFQFADNLYFENNYLHHTAFDGVKFNQAWLAPSEPNKTFNFSPQEIKTGDILVAHNVIEKTCQMVTDCGALTFAGQPNANHVFRDVLISNNIIHHNFGWSAVAELRGKLNSYFAMGIYATYSSGLVIYRNLLYKNSWTNIFGFQGWRDGEFLVINNVLANANYGLELWNNKDFETHESVNTQIFNNIFANNEEFGIHHKGMTTETPFKLDYNLYYANSWQVSAAKLGVMSSHGTVYSILSDVRAETPWEQHGVVLDPKFLNYDYFEVRDFYENQAVNFQINQNSGGLDRGMAIPARVTELLQKFGLTDQQVFGAVDIGAAEFIDKNQAITFNQQTATYPITTAQFLINANVQSSPAIFNATEHVTVSAEIIADPRDVGQVADIFMVGVYVSPEQLYFALMRQGEQWVRWNEKLASLLPAVTVTLPERLPLEIYTGTFVGMPGRFVIYVGYAVNGKLTYSGQLPLNFTVQ